MRVAARLNRIRNSFRCVSEISCQLSSACQDRCCEFTIASNRHGVRAIDLVLVVKPR